MLQKAYVYINIFLVLWYRFIFCRFGRAFYVDPMYQLDLLPLNCIPQNPRISRGLQAMPELLDLYATLLDFTCHYTSDSVYIFILAFLYLRLLKILPYIRTVDIQMKLVRVSLFLIISCYMKDFFFSRKPSIKEMQQEKTEEKKIKIRNPQKHLCPTVMYHIRQALYNCYTDVAPRLHVMHCTYEHPISAQNPKYM